MTRILVGIIILVTIAALFLVGPSFFLKPQTLSPIPKSPSPTSYISSTATPSPTIYSTPTVKPIIRRTRSATITLFGDSMIQTMGEAKTLKNYLEEEYQDLQIRIINLGVGATTVENGLSRVQTIIDSRPDIVILESFSYNHLSKDGAGLSRHKEVLAEIISSLKQSGIAKIVILATIAPVELYAQDASESAGWSPSFRREEADWIKRYLENSVELANLQNLPLVNAYKASLGQDGYGKAFYVNPKDDIHPSDAGHDFVSWLIFEKLKELGWLKK